MLAPLHFLQTRLKKKKTQMNQPCVRSSLSSFVSPDEDDERDLAKLEEKVWDPNSSLTEKQIDQFLVVAR